MVERLLQTPRGCLRRRCRAHHRRKDQTPQHRSVAAPAARPASTTSTRAGDATRASHERTNPMNNLLDVLTREGVLINVSVRYWRGCKKLRPEDLGLQADAVSDRLISLGHKRLLPKSATAALALIEGRAHALID